MQIELQPYTQQKKIPGPPALPIVGSFPFIGKRQYLAYTKLAKEYGDIFQVRIFFQNLVVLNRLETIKEALLKQQDEFAGRPQIYILKNAIEGNSIGGRDYNALWKRHREIAVNALHTVLDNKTVEEQVVEEANELTNILLSYKGQPFPPEVDISLSSANFMSRIIFGEKYNRDDEDFLNLGKNAQSFTNKNATAVFFISLMSLPFIQKNDKLKKVFQEKLGIWKEAANISERLFLKKLNEHRASYNPEHLRGVADALLKAASEIDESEKQTLGLTEEVIVEATVQEMMGTGTQPVAPILHWAILYMIAYPDIQAQVQQELDVFIAKEQAVRFEDRTKLRFTQVCIYEILRHAPSFPMGIPHATTTDTTLNGYFIPKNTPVSINLYSLTRDDRYWEEPEKFNPRRFLTESGEIREDLLDKYYPFGLGKRRCLGEYFGRLAIFSFFANLMHKCKFEKVADEKLTFEGLPGAIVTPSPYKVIVKPRF
ncbi:cytochrome P450 [Desmonostoc muscorum]|uniref:cytochrome P450 n=1 Tax=Desmonostoc muscorum TaxID=1179 RepID=UPI001F313BF2|nr:cytochrome P450 [Desmonostoc muscorum]